MIEKYEYFKGGVCAFCSLCIKKKKPQSREFLRDWRWDASVPLCVPRFWWSCTTWSVFLLLCPSGYSGRARRNRALGWRSVIVYTASFRHRKALFFPIMYPLDILLTVFHSLSPRRSLIADTGSLWIYVLQKSHGRCQRSSENSVVITNFEDGCLALSHALQTSSLYT